MSRRRRGAAALEFALWMPVMLLMFGGIVDLSLYMNNVHGVVRVVREAARLTASTGLGGLVATTTTAIDAEMEANCLTHANKVLTDMNDSCGTGCTLTCAWRTDTTPAAAALDSPPEIITVTLSKPYRTILNLVPSLTSVNARAQFVMVTTIQVDDIVP